MQLRDKVVVITGSGRGIGEASARRFVAEGAKVVVTDINGDDVDRVTSELSTVGLTVDITVEENVRRVAELARNTYGEIDLWWSNAGVDGPRQPGEIPDNALWNLGWNLHVMAHVYAARAVLPAMVERGEGYLLHTASLVALSMHLEKGAYSVTKHAAIALSEWLAATYRSRGVKVSCFCPGPMLTPMLLGNEFPPDHPAMERAVTPEQVADLIVGAVDAERFLVTDSEWATQALEAKATDYEQWLAGMTAP